MFEHELTWMLLHQYFSFNSPVWFNVGTASPQQVSACFILSVDDSWDSILNWYREEGFIFKGRLGCRPMTLTDPTEGAAVKANGVKDVIRLHLEQATPSTSPQITWYGRAPTSVREGSSPPVRCEPATCWSGIDAPRSGRPRSASSTSQKLRWRDGCNPTASSVSTPGTNRSLTMEALSGDPG